MARKWSGFLAQNLATKEEWQMLEACEAQVKGVNLARQRPKAPAARAPFKRKTSVPLIKEK